MIEITRTVAAIEVSQPAQQNVFLSPVQTTVTITSGPGVGPIGPAGVQGPQGPQGESFVPTVLDCGNF